MSRIKEVIIFILFILFYINETTFIALYSVLISTEKLKLSQRIMMTVKDLEMKSHLRVEILNLLEQTHKRMW